MNNIVGDGNGYVGNVGFQVEIVYFIVISLMW